jgi:protease-4
LVDELAYRDQAYDKVKQRAGAGAELLYLDKYLERAGRPHEHGPRIALIYGIGAVQRGSGGFDPMSGSSAMGADTVAAAFRAAMDDDKVKAILFRVDSPGGSYVGSDEIWREVVRARQAHKPVIVSMGNLAGSGGYFVAMAADKIVAEPGTITGSIGVLGGKLVAHGTWDKIGVSWDEVHDGAHARMWSMLEDYSPAEWARLEASLDRVYVDFTNKVAEGRKLPKTRVLELAKGRIWSGEDAKAFGLVDELGGYATALRLAKEAAHIPADSDVELCEFPRPKGVIEQLLAKGPDNSDKEGAELLARAVRAAAPLLRAAHIVEGTASDGVLSMPPIEER